MAEVRTVGIPKPDGGERPISLAQLLWRIANTCLVAKLVSWVDQWAPDELAGGLKGRWPEEIHAALEAEIQSAHRMGSMFSACKEDVRRAFPSIRLPIALRILERCGLPRALAAHIEDFYAQLTHWFEAGGGR